MISENPALFLWIAGRGMNADMTFDGFRAFVLELASVLRAGGRST